MEEEHVTILDLDPDPCDSARVHPEPSCSDVASLDLVEPSMPLSLLYSSEQSCPGSFQVTDQPNVDLFSSACALPESSCLHSCDDDHSPSGLWSLDALDCDFKLEYASEYTRDVPEYKVATPPQEDKIWQLYHESDELWLPSKENAASPKKQKRAYHKRHKEAIVTSCKHPPTPAARFFSAEERLELARYAAKHGVDETSDHFSDLWNKSVSKKVVFTALEKYKMAKRSSQQEPTPEMMQASNKFSQTDRVQMAVSCKEIGPTKTAKLFSEKLGMVISESTVRGFAKKLLP